jgi:hypothetical protein
VAGCPSPLQFQEDRALASNSPQPLIAGTLARRPVRRILTGVRGPILVVVILAACSDGLSGERELRGIVTMGFEIQAFRECGATADYWMTYDVDTPGRAEFEEVLGEWGGGQPVRRIYAEVRADVSEPGSYGHLGAFPREITVLDFEDARETPPADCR